MRQIDERLGPMRGKAVTVVAVLDEQPGAEAEGQRQPRRRKAERRRPDRRRSASRRRRAISTGSPGAQRAPRPRSSAAAASATSSRLAVVEIERGEIGVRLRRRDDAALMRAAERLDVVAARRAAARLCAAPRPARASRRRRRRRPPSRRESRGASRAACRSRSVIASPWPACSCRPRHSRSRCRRAPWRGRTGRRCPAAIAPGRNRSIARRAACRWPGSISTTWPFLPLQARRWPFGVAASASGRCSSPSLVTVRPVPALPVRVGASGIATIWLSTASET